MIVSSTDLAFVSDTYRKLVASQHPAHTWTSENVKHCFSLLASIFGLILYKYTACAGNEVHYVLVSEDGKPEDLEAFGEFCKGKLAWRTGERSYGYHINLPLPSWGYIYAEGSIHDFLLRLDGAQ